MSLFSNWLNDNMWDYFSGGEHESPPLSPGSMVDASVPTTYENEYNVDHGYRYSDGEYDGEGRKVE